MKGTAPTSRRCSCQNEHFPGLPMQSGNCCRLQVVSQRKQRLRWRPLLVCPDIPLFRLLDRWGGVTGSATRRLTVRLKVLLVANTSYDRAPSSCRRLPTTSPPHHLTTSPPHHLTTLPPHHLTTLPPHHLITSPPHLLTTRPPPHKLTTAPPPTSPPYRLITY